MPEAVVEPDPNLNRTEVRGPGGSLNGGAPAARTTLVKRELG
jgi:hypothetical protein